MEKSTSRTRTAAGVAAALALGLVFRLLIVSWFPFDAAGDTGLYENLARGLLHRGGFGLEIAGRFQPVDVRMPGYPAFLAATEALLGPGRGPVRVAQAVVDTATCALAGLAAALLASRERRRRAFVAGVWLAALCPFTANYTAALLAETAGAFWTTTAFVAIAWGVRRAQERGTLDRRAAAALGAAGLAAGLGCFFRPETPLLLAGPAVVLGLEWRRPRVSGSAPTPERLAQLGLKDPAKRGTPAALEGDTRLGQAAVDAVKQWRYEPVVKDGKPVDVQATVTVNFKLS
ncbi:MAG: energy transducer TonB [Vicinamibacteria bacterium]